MQIRRAAILCLTMVVVACLLFGCTPRSADFRVKFVGSSMEPNYHDGQSVTIEPVNSGNLRRGDVIYFEQDGKKWLKRLIGLPGEKIEVQPGQVVVNDQTLVEPYKVDPSAYSYGPVTLKENEFFVLGDDRDHSSDSHTYGPILGSTIIGKAIP